MSANWSQTVAAVAKQIDVLKKTLGRRSEPAFKRVRRALDKVQGRLPSVDFAPLLAAARIDDQDAYGRARVSFGQALKSAQKQVARDKVLRKIDANPIAATNILDVVNQFTRADGSGDHGVT